MNLLARQAGRLVLLILSLLGGSAVLAAPATLSLVFEDKDSFPNYLGDGKDIDWKRPGFAVEFLVLVADELNLKLEFERAPWKRCLFMTENNMVDGTFNASFSPDRLSMGRYPMNKKGEPDAARRITDMTYSFYKLKRTDLSWDGKKFTNLQTPIGTVSGYSITKALQEKGLPIDDGAQASTNLLSKLLAGRIQVIASSEFQIEHILDGNPEKYRDVEQMPVPFQTKPYYLLLSRKFVQENPELAESIWDAIGRLRDSPKVKKIRAKYAAQ